MDRQRNSINAAQEDTTTARQAVLDQFLLDTNLRFDKVMMVIRELQRNVNQLTPSGLRERIQEIVNIDPLIPKADKFEKDLEALEKTLRENEVTELLLSHILTEASIRHQSKTLFSVSWKMLHPGQNSKTSFLND